MNSRLLHAAARGARIQSQYHNWTTGGLEWREADLNKLYGSRIHPDDEHLSYGPISTELRKEAEFPPSKMLFFRGHLFYYISIYKGLYDSHQEMSTLEQQLFLLILAETLADEGL